MDAKNRAETALRNLPSVDEVLRTDTGREFADAAGASAAADAARRAVDEVRRAVLSGRADEKETLLDRTERFLGSELERETMSGMRRVINATGVVIHTNLGRAPLAREAREALPAAAGYCNLEYDMETGRRGRRGRSAERYAAELAGADEAVIVNNGAAAAFLTLSALASGGEVVVSRGELVEIGGDFRIPDVLAASGAKLREVGTTNRTRLADYERAIGDHTRMLLRVHPSNYRIVGFTATPSRREIAGLARARSLIFYEDLGSGALLDLGGHGLKEEPVVADAVREGADLVSFSGDKLLGGPQAGIVVGRADLVLRLREHPLYRVLRPDKLAYAALEATLALYRRKVADQHIPVLAQLKLTAGEIGARAENLVNSVKAASLTIEIVDGSSAVGGGAAPTAQLPTRLIAITHKARSAEVLERQLRMNGVPVIGRIESDMLLLDLRTVTEEEEEILADAIMALDN